LLLRIVGGADRPMTLRRYRSGQPSAPPSPLPRSDEAGFPAARADPWAEAWAEAAAAEESDRRALRRGSAYTIVFAALFWAVTAAVLYFLLFAASP
jgi:hypothetical protein